MLGAGWWIEFFHYTSVLSQENMHFSESVFLPLPIGDKEEENVSLILSLNVYYTWRDNAEVFAQLHTRKLKLFGEIRVFWYTRK